MPPSTGVFGTWTLPTGTSEASRRGEGGLCRIFGTEAGADIRGGLQPGLMEAGSKEVTWTFEVINKFSWCDLNIIGKIERTIEAYIQYLPSVKGLLKRKQTSI